MKSELYFSELVPIGLLESVADFGIANSIAIGEREQTISIARELGKPINLSDNWSIYRKIDLSIGQLIYLSKNWSIYQKLMYLSNNLSIYRTIDLSIEQLIYLSNNWSICRTIDLSMEQLIYLLNNKSIYRTIDLSIYLSIDVRQNQSAICNWCRISYEKNFLRGGVWTQTRRDTETLTHVVIKKEAAYLNIQLFFH